MTARIVAGVARGRRLRVARQGTRPTSERTREALFSSLGDVSGLRVLDLYAGSGAVGLEALSRGAAAAVLVESGREAAAAIAENITVLGLAGARLVRATVAGYLGAAPDDPFDIVFADPPYATPDSELERQLAALASSGRLAEGADVVIERSSHSSAPRWPGVIEATKSRRYGDAMLWYGRRR